MSNDLPPVGRVTKANALIRASYRLKLEEQRLILACLVQIDTRQAVPDKLTVYALDYARQFGLGQKSAYSQLKAVAEQLYARELTLQAPRRLRRSHIRWVQQIDYFDGEGRVDLYFSDRIKAYLGQLHGDFSSYRIDHVADLTCVYALRLYEMLIQWSDIRRTLDISLGDLRDRLQLGGRYPAFDNLRRRVIEPALYDLNAHSNLLVQWVPVRRGRSIVALRFAFEPKRCAA